MENEKILSNEELLEVTAGSSFLSTDELEGMTSKFNPVIAKYGIAMLRPHKKPISGITLLYAVQPN